MKIANLIDVLYVCKSWTVSLSLHIRLLMIPSIMRGHVQLLESFDNVEKKATYCLLSRGTIYATRVRVSSLQFFNFKL